MRRRKKQNSWITLSVSVGAIVLFGLVSVFLVWISGNTGDAFSGKWDDYDVILDENCAPGALEGECDRTQVEYGSLRYRLNTAPWFAAVSYTHLLAAVRFLPIQRILFANGLKKAATADVYKRQGHSGGKSDFPSLTVQRRRGSSFAAGGSFGASENLGRRLQKYHSDNCFGGVTNDSFKHAVLCA